MRMKITFQEDRMDTPAPEDALAPTLTHAGNLARKAFQRQSAAPQAAAPASCQVHADAWWRRAAANDAGRCAEIVRQP
jgi:hypothetical protein